jgi:hypothetical protein
MAKTRTVSVAKWLNGVSPSDQIFGINESEVGYAKIKD